MSELREQLIAWRHQIHRHPELAFEEVKTAELVAGELRKMGIEVAEGIGKTGVVGTLKAGDGKKVIGLRADMDCIAMQEMGTCEYKSETPGQMHACGHDGHTASLLGAAKILSESRDFNGTVRFVFQPAEEPGKGADAMIADGLFERFPMDEIYGIHNMVQWPAGTIATRSEGIMASEDNFVITIKGEGAHASAPNLAKDPLVIAAEIILALQTIVSRNVNPVKQAVISCTEFFTDGVHNAIPSTVVIKGDTRSTDSEVQKLIEDRMRELCITICRMNGAECEFEYTHEFVPTINARTCTESAVRAAQKVVGSEKVDGDCLPLMGSEDFAKFLAVIPGNFAFIGSGREGDNPALHNSRYDYNDDVLEIGAQYYAEVVREILQ